MGLFDNAIRPGSILDKFNRWVAAQNMGGQIYHTGSNAMHSMIDPIKWDASSQKFVPDPSKPIPHPFAPRRPELPAGVGAVGAPADIVGPLGAIGNGMDIPDTASPIFAKMSDITPIKPPAGLEAVIRNAVQKSAPKPVVQVTAPTGDYAGNDQTSMFPADEDFSAIQGADLPQEAEPLPMSTRSIPAMNLEGGARTELPQQHNNLLKVLLGRMF